MFFHVFPDNLPFLQLARVIEKKNISWLINGTLLFNFRGKLWVYFSKLILNAMSFFASRKSGKFELSWMKKDYKV